MCEGFPVKRLQLKFPFLPKCVLRPCCPVVRFPFAFVFILSGLSFSCWEGL